jgi:hypothetical protein
MTTATPAANTGSTGGTSSSAVTKLEALQKKLTKVMTRMEGDDATYQVGAGAANTGKNDAQAVSR